MSRWLKFFGAYGAAFVAAAVSGAEVSMETAETVAGAFLRTSSMASRVLPDRTVAQSSKWGNLWIVGLSPSGYIVVSGSDKCAPVIQFSPEDFSDPEEDSAYFDIMSAASNLCADREVDESLDADPEWTKLTTPVKRRLLASASEPEPDEGNCEEYVAPILGASWDQDSPYSDFTPATGPCGCMATAAGQEIRYWRWPWRMTGSRTHTHAFYKHPAQGHTIRVNGEVPFDYDRILGNYSSSPYTPNATGEDKLNRYEAAYLTLWMQSLVEMGFSNGGSGGHQKFCNNASRFWFEQGTVMNRDRNGYTDLWNAIKDDLDFGSPIQVNTRNHQMVIDGYAVEGSGDSAKHWININYGWGESIKWIDMKTQYDSAGLADFQIGLRPQKRVLVEPMPKVSRSTVELKWHLPPIYTNKITKCIIDICTLAADTISFSDDLSASPGTPENDHFKVSDQRLSGTSGVSGIYTYENTYHYISESSVLSFDSFSRYMAGSEATVEGRFDGGSWERIYTIELNEHGEDASVSRRTVNLSKKYAGRTMQLRFKLDCVSSSYYTSNNPILQIDNVEISNVRNVYYQGSIDVPNNGTDCYTKAIFGLVSGERYIFSIAPVMADDSAAIGTSVMTEVGDPQSDPEITGISIPASNIDMLQEGFYAECDIGRVNSIYVTCSSSTTTLQALPSHLDVLPDSKVSVQKSGNVFTVNLDASDMASEWNGEMIMLTLVAANSDGTEAYKNLMLRFSNVRQVINGTYKAVDSGTTSEPLCFCGDCVLDANGNTIIIAENTFTGTGIVTVTNSLDRGMFDSPNLGGFSGTLVFKVPVSGSFPETSTIRVDSGESITVNGADALSRITGGGRIYVTGGVNTLGDCTSFSGSITVQSGATLTIAAGDEGSITVQSGATLLVELTEEQENFGYTLSHVTRQEGGTVIFVDSSGVEHAPVESGGNLVFKATANIWTSGGSSSGRYGDSSRWSRGVIPGNGDYALIMASEDSSIELDLPSDVALKAIKVIGSGSLSIESGGSHTMTIDSFANDIPVRLKTAQIRPALLAPAADIVIDDGVRLTSEIDFDSSSYLRKETAQDTYASALTEPELWNGTVVCKGTILVDFNPNSLGNSESKVRLNGTKGHFAKNTNNIEFEPVVELADDGETPAVWWDNGYSDSTTIFDRLSGNGLFKTNEKGVNEKVLIKDISDFAGSFGLSTKTVALGMQAMPYSLCSTNGGRLVIGCDAEIAAGETWITLDGIYLAGSSELSVAGTMDTTEFKVYGSGSSVNLADGGRINIKSISSDYPVSWNLGAGTFAIASNMTINAAMNFCAGSGRRTTIDVAGNTLVLGADSMSGSGDVYLTSSVQPIGTVVINGLDGFAGTLHIDGSVNVILPDDLSRSHCTIDLANAEVKVKSNHKCTINVGPGAKLSLVLTVYQMVHGCDMSSKVHLEGGAVQFVNSSGDIVSTGSYTPAKWVSGEFLETHGGFSIDLNGNSITSAGNIKVESGTKVGASIDISALECTAASVLVKYSAPAGGAPVANASIVGVTSSIGLPIGAYTASAGAESLTGYWLNGQSIMTGYSFSDPLPAIQSGGTGYMLFAHQSQAYGEELTTGTALYMGSSLYDLEGFTGGNYSGLQWRGHSVNTLAIGGPSGSGNAKPWQGLEIEEITVFPGEWITPDLLYVVMEDQRHTATVSEDATFEATTFTPELPVDSSYSKVDITVTDDAVLDVPVDGATVQEINFYVAEGVTLTLSGGTLSAETIGIYGGAVECTDANALSGTVVGNGTLVYSGVLPHVGSSGIDLSMAAMWNGTLWLKNVRGTADNSAAGGDRVSTNLGNFIYYGNSNSRVRLTDVQAYLRNASDSHLWTLTLEDGEYVAWENDNGWTGNVHEFAALDGTGTFLDRYDSCFQTIRFCSANTFGGAIRTNGKRILFGDAFSSDTATRGSIAIGANAEITIPFGKTWESGGEFSVKGVLTNYGTISIPSATAKESSNAATELSVTLSVAGRLVNADTISIAGPADVTGTLAFRENGMLDGSAVLRDGATLDLTEYTGSKPVAGILTVENGAAIKLPAGVSFPYTLADSVYVVSSPCSVTVDIGGSSSMGVLKIVDGAIVQDREATFEGGEEPMPWSSLGWDVGYADIATAESVVVNVAGSGTIDLGSASVAGKVVFNVPDANVELVLTGTLSATEIWINGLGSVKCSAANTLAGTLKGDGTVIYSVKPNLGYGNLVATDDEWEGVVWIKGTSVSIGGIVPSQCAGPNSTLRLTGCTGYFNNSGEKQVSAGTLELEDDGETKAFTINNGYSQSGITVFEKLTGSGTFTSTDCDIYQRYVFKDPSEFTGSIVIPALTADHNTYRRFRVILGDGENLNPATGTITVVGGATASIAAGREWTAQSEIILSGSYENKCTLKIEGDGSVSGDLTANAYSTLDLSEYSGDKPINGQLALQSGSEIKIPAGAAFPYRLADKISGTPSFKIGDFTYGGEYTLDDGALNLVSYKAISIDFGSNQDGGNAALNYYEWAGIAPVTNWLNTADSGADSNYPATLSSLKISDSEGVSYDSMKLYLCSRGGNYYGKGNTTASATSALLYGFLDDYDGYNINAGVKLTGVNAFSRNYSLYVYFNRDSDVGTVNAFPPYYINGIPYYGDGSATVPGYQVWGTVRANSLENGVNALVVRGLKDDTLVIAQPNSAGGRGCISGIQIVDDPDGEFVWPYPSVSFTPPSTDWDGMSMPAVAMAKSDGSESSLSFGNKGLYQQLVDGRLQVVANLTGGTYTEVYGLLKSNETIGDANHDIYLAVSGDASVSRVGGVQSAYYSGSVTANTTGNALVQIGGNATVGYAYGAGYQGGSDATVTGDTGVTIKDGAVLTGSAVGGWASQHQANPRVSGNTSVMVLNVQSINSAGEDGAISNDAIVGGSVYRSNAASTSATISGDSSASVDLSGLALTQGTNFTKRIIGGCAALRSNDNRGGTYAVNGSSSVTITAPEEVVFTKDITGAGCIVDANTIMYATVGGNSSVTINGGTYRGVTITAGARGPDAAKATVAGTATLTINGGVFDGATLRGGNATGAKTLAVNGKVDLTGTSIDGFTARQIGADAIVWMTAGEEGTVTIGKGACLKLVVDNGKLISGYVPSGVSGSGSVEYYESVNGEMRQVTESGRLSGNSLLPHTPGWSPAAADVDGNLGDPERWSTGYIPNDSVSTVNIAVNGENTLTVNATRTYGTVNFTGTGTLLLEGYGENYLAAGSLSIGEGVTVKVHGAGMLLRASSGVSGGGSLVLESGAEFTLGVMPSVPVRIEAGATFTLENASWTGVADMFAGDGTLELFANTSSCSEYSAASTFAGHLKVTGNATKVPYFNGVASQFSQRPEFELSGYMTLTDKYAGGDKKFIVRNLTGAVGSRIDPYYNNIEFKPRYVSTLQTKDTEFCGNFDGATDAGGRKTALYVYGENGNVHSLTLSGSNVTRGPLEIDEYGKVIFADRESSQGSWAYGTVTVGANAYLKSDSTALTVAGTLSLQDGATLVRGTEPFRVGALSVATDANVNVDLTGLEITNDGIDLITSTNEVIPAGMDVSCFTPVGFPRHVELYAVDGAIRVKTTDIISDNMIVGYMDGNTAIVSNTVHTVAIPDEATGLDIYPTSSTMTFTGGNKVKTVRILTKYRNGEGVECEEVVTGVFEPYGGGMRLNPNGRKEIGTETVTVAPEVDASDTPMGTDSESGNAIFNVRAIPGFYYAVKGGNQLDGEGNLSGDTVLGEAVQATESRVRPIAPALGGRAVKFFKISAAISPEEFSENGD